MTEDYTEAKLGYLIRMDTHASLPRPQSHIISRLFFSFFTVSICLFLHCVQASSRMSSSCLPHCCTYKEGLLTLTGGRPEIRTRIPLFCFSRSSGHTFSLYWPCISSLWDSICPNSLDISSSWNPLFYFWTSASLSYYHLPTGYSISGSRDTVCLLAVISCSCWNVLCFFSVIVCLWMYFASFWESNGFWPCYALCAARTLCFRRINIHNGKRQPPHLYMIAPTSVARLPLAHLHIVV